MIDFDPKVIRAHAASLYSRARALVIGTSFGAAMVAGVAGYLFLAYVPGFIVTVQEARGGAMMAAFLGAVLGYVRGSAAAARLRLEAQLALCQVSIEEQLRRLAHADRMAGRGIDMGSM